MASTGSTHGERASSGLDWDTPIILDACRYDVFADVADLPGTTDARYSLAPATYEFVRANLSETRLADTIYLGAATWFLRLRDEIGAEVFKMVDLQPDEADIEWADEESNVPAPSAVTMVTGRTFCSEWLVVSGSSQRNHRQGIARRSRQRRRKEADTTALSSYRVQERCDTDRVSRGVRCATPNCLQLA